MLLTFFGVGYLVMHFVIGQSVQMSASDPERRLAGMMAGLFAGGAAACLVGIITLAGKRPEA